MKIEDLEVIVRIWRTETESALLAELKDGIMNRYTDFLEGQLKAFDLVLDKIVGDKNENSKNQ